MIHLLSFGGVANKAGFKPVADPDHLYYNLDSAKMIMLYVSKKEFSCDELI